MPDVIDLRPNQDLIDSNFTGYKLSLASLSTYSEKNTETPLKVSSSSCGYKETKLFSLHNHLFTKNDNYVYYIDASFVVQEVSLDPMNGIFSKSSVWELPHEQEPIYNPTLDFPSDKLAVVSDGISSLYILEISKEISTWKVMRKIDVDCAAIIKHSKLIEDKLHCLLYNLVENKSNLLWIEIDLSSGQFDVHEFNSQGDLHFAQVIESDAILVGAEKTFFPETNNAEIKYVWSQDSDFIKAEFRVGSKLTVKEGIIQVLDKDDVLMEGKLGGEVVETSVVVEFDEGNGILALTASKPVSGVKWSELIEGLPGDYKADEQEVDEANSKLDKFTTENEIYYSSSLGNNADLEECDFPANQDAVIERLKKTGATHRSNLGSSKYLFNATDSIVLMQDEDANLWQNVCESGEWRFKHVASLTAMGYIQASKQRKKIMTCSPNHDYVVISESHCHVFIYRQNHSFGGELRNRKCGKTLQQLAQQFVLNLGQDEILGVAATDHVLYMLTEKQMFASILN